MGLDLLKDWNLKQTNTGTKNNRLTNLSITIKSCHFAPDQNTKYSQGKSVVFPVVNGTISIASWPGIDYNLEADIDNGYKYKD